MIFTKPCSAWGSGRASNSEQDLFQSGISCTVSGIQRNISINYIGFEFKNYPVEIHFDSNKSAFSLKFPLIKDKDMLIADLDAAGIDSAEFEKYPNYGSGFIVLKNNSGINYMETNHFVKIIYDISSKYLIKS